MAKLSADRSKTLTMSRERERESPDQQAQRFFHEAAQWTGMQVPLLGRFLEGMQVLYKDGWRLSRGPFAGDFSYDDITEALEQLFETGQELLPTSSIATEFVLPAGIYRDIEELAKDLELPDTLGFRQAVVHLVFSDLCGYRVHGTMPSFPSDEVI